MKKCVKMLACVAALITLAGGCISYEYTGSSEAPVAGEAKIFASRNDLKRQYKVLGRAVVAANYQDVSRDAMLKKLAAKAAENGADAVIIVEQQVVPVEYDGNTQPRFNTADDYDNNSQSWIQIYRDVDQSFTNSQRKTVQGSKGVSNEFRRIITADFVRYTGK